jgi:hypothetical protein
VNSEQWSVKAPQRSQEKADSSLTTPELKNVRGPFVQNDTANFYFGLQALGAVFEDSFCG